MPEKKRYRLRNNSVALTRLQWLLACSGLLLGVIGLVLGLSGMEWGFALTGIGAMSTGLITISSIGTMS